MSGPGWDTGSFGGNRMAGRDHLVLILGVALLAVVLLAALVGKVLATESLNLANSSPAADHMKASTSQPQPEVPNSRDLFLDLPDPSVVAKPEPPITPEQNSDIRTSGNTASVSKVSESASTFSRPSEARNTRNPNRRAGGRDVKIKTGMAPGASNALANQKPPINTRTVGPGSGNVEDLLDDPDCRFSIFALTDLKNGIVDEYLISALQAVCREHSIYVNVFKTGHTFGAGLEEGPTIPTGYGNAGGYPNTHYFGRGADIWEVDGKPVEGNGDDPDVVSVGRMLAGLPDKNSPDIVIGPDAWNRALGYGPEQGWVLAGDQVVLHEDHLHIGYWEGDGTLPSNLSIPETEIPPHETYPYTDSGVVRNSEKSSDRASSRSSSRSSAQKPSPKLKERLKPSVAPPPSKSRPAKETIKKRDRRPGPQKTVMRWIQRNGPQDPQDRQNLNPARLDQERPDKPESKKTEPKKTNPGKHPEGDSPSPEPNRINPGEREPKQKPPEPDQPPPEPVEASPDEERVEEPVAEKPAIEEPVAEEPAIGESVAGEGSYDGGVMDEDTASTD